MSILKDDPKKYWAYRHVNGYVHLKVYSAQYGERDMKDAEDSDFVYDVFGPFTAWNRIDARRQAKEMLAEVS